MCDVRACRGCLSVSGKLDKLTDQLRKVFTDVTGLQLQEGDGYPMYFCLQCRSQLKKAFTFRRRCKRAFYVMKELMIVRKRVTLDDIKIVDRKKTNLLSTVGVWEPNGSGFYKNEHQTGSIDVLQTGHMNLVRYTPKLTDTYICHSVNVLPTDPVTGLEAVEEEHKPAHLEDDLFDNNDFVIEDNDVSDVDLDDVFKGLKEDSPSDSDGLEDLFIKNVVTAPKPVERKKKNKPVPGQMLSLIDNQVNALSYYEIRTLEHSEQIKIHKNRLTIDVIYRGHKFKCSMCVIGLPSIAHLKKHVEQHNAQSSQRNTLKCDICLLCVGTQAELNSHVSRVHRYIYTCALCKMTVFTFHDTLDHLNKVHRKCTIEWHTEKPGGKDILKPQKTRYVKDNIVKYFKLKSKSTEDVLKAVDKSSVRMHSSTCPYCFVKLSKRKQHIANIHSNIGPRAMKCDPCGVWFRGKVRLQRHMEDCHLYTYHCKKCPEVLPFKAASIIHLRTHGVIFKRRKVQITKYRCQHCNSVFDKIGGLSKHKVEVHPEKRFSCHCAECGAAFVLLHQLYRHQLEDHSYVTIASTAQGPPEYKCISCNVQFCNETAYHSHILLVHETTGQYVCETCGLCLEEAADLEKHVSTCGERTATVYKCYYCAEEFLIFRQLYVHHQKTHSEHPFRRGGSDEGLCYLCGKYVQISKFKHHMVDHHRKEKNRKPVETTEFSILGTDPSKCPISSSCSYTNSNPCMLFNHILRFHTTNAYWCAVCYKSFSRISYCREHILRFHKPARLYECQMCGKDWAHRCPYKSHMWKKHKQKVTIDNQYKRHKEIISAVFNNVVIFPFMFINISLVPLEILKNCRWVISDFAFEKFTPIKDYEQYLITDTKPLLDKRQELERIESQNITPKQTKRKHQYEKQKTKEKMAKKAIEPETIVTVTKEIRLHENVNPDKEYTASLAISDDGSYQLNNISESVEAANDETFEDDANEYEAVEYVTDEVLDEDELEMEDDGNEYEVEDSTDQTGMTEADETVVEINPDQEYEVFVKDGEQYVLVDGSIFKVEKS